MYDVLIALTPAFLVSLYLFGISALVLTSVAVASCLLFEYLIQKYLLKTEVTTSDGSALLTGILLAFNLPASLPIWMVVVGSLVAIGVVTGTGAAIAAGGDDADTPITGDALTKASNKITLAVIIGAVVINLAIENIVEPALTGKQLKLSPTAVFVSFFFWGWLLGPVGVFLSMPITVLLLLMLDSSEQPAWAARLIGSSRE